MKLLLLDANIVITAHQLGVWNALISRYTLYIPSVVLEAEAKYFVSKMGQQSIDLKPYIESGQMIRVEATIDEVTAFRAQFRESFLEVIDDGEQEALALVLSGKLPDCKFCTGDGPAILALGLLYMSDSGVSFEEVLRRTGITKKIEFWFTDGYFKKQLSLALTQRSLHCVN